MKETEEDGGKLEPHCIEDIAVVVESMNIYYKIICNQNISQYGDVEYGDLNAENAENLVVSLSYLASFNFAQFCE